MKIYENKQVTILAWVTLAEVLAMSLWFSASAVSETLTQVMNLQAYQVPWITASVQLGFVAGAIISATLGIQDRFNSRLIFSMAASAASLTNILFVIEIHYILLAFILRFLTGMFLAGIYPVAVQFISTWFPRGKGLAIGLLIGGLTIGSALPEFIAGLSLSNSWELLILTSSGLGFLSALISIFTFHDAPVPFHSNRLNWKHILHVLKNKSLMYDNMGYFGHMWELYAMWTWLPIFLYLSWKGFFPIKTLIGYSTIADFAAIGVAGIVGSIIGGYIADRIGRTFETIASLSISGLCSIFIGFTFGGIPIVTFVIAFIWGVFVISDSAQFSTAVTELSPMEYVGTALALQMAVGFLITVGSIDLISYMVPIVGWKFAFSFLSVGPVLGIVSMLRLRGMPESIMLASGRR